MSTHVKQAVMGGSGGCGVKRLSTIRPESVRVRGSAGSICCCWRCRRCYSPARPRELVNERVLWMYACTRTRKWCMGPANTWHQQSPGCSICLNNVIGVDNAPMKPVRLQPLLQECPEVLDGGEPLTQQRSCSCCSLSARLRSVRAIPDRS